MPLKYSVEVVSGSLYDLGEGPFWDEKVKRLYFVDAFVGDFVKLDPETGKDEKIHLDGIVTIIIPCEDNGDEFIVTKMRGIYRMNWKTKATALLAEVETESDHTRFNDGKCDAKGRLWVGTMGMETSPGAVVSKLGSLYLMDGALNVSLKVPKVSLSNGIAWSRDNTRMYFNDSAKRHVYVFDFDLETGTTANQRVLFDFNNNPVCREKEFPDGLAIDEENNLWVACYDGGRILRVDSQTGALIDFIELPATQITSLCFGGDNCDTLYVTSARKGLTADQAKAQPLAGSIFKVTLESIKAKGYIGKRFVSK